jgi:hypothetical protein
MANDSPNGVQAGPINIDSGLREAPNSCDDHLIDGYSVALAEDTERHERDMTLMQALRADKRLILYSLGFSGTIIMEGYGLALVTYLFVFDQFNETYGEAIGNKIEVLILILFHDFH